MSAPASSHRKTALYRVGTILAAALAFSGCEQGTFVQRASSMAPTVREGETVHVQMGTYRFTAPRRWDVVAFTPPAPAVPAAKDGVPPGVWIFRIVGLPGETISFDEHSLLIEGHPPGDRPESIRGIRYRSVAGDAPPGMRSPTYPLTIPDGQVFVLGDNPDHANDSRLWGPLPLKNILGKVDKK